MTPIHALLSGIVDYAGLYPPARLGMAESVRNYAEHLRCGHSWMLGRFICPVSRLEEFRKASVGLLPTRPVSQEQHTGPVHHNGLVPDTHAHHADQPWPISAIIDGDLDENLDSIFAFNHEHSKPSNGLAVVDAIEIRIPEATGAGPAGGGAAVFIDEALDLVPEEVFPFFEIPILPGSSGADPDFRGPIAALSGADAGAKLRTGGLTPDAFPSPERVAEFVAACHAADVPFKATAGLHHPVRSEHPLTYEAGCSRGIMHGFLNLFVAAALIRARKADADLAIAVLREQDPRAFAFSDEALVVRGESLDAAELAAARETFALSFGSCSFTEPVEDLRRLGLA